MAPFYAEQLSDVAISSGEKTKLFNRLEDYPEMSNSLLIFHILCLSIYFNRIKL
jgi:DNA mismatch repair protein MSH3